jgi:hypothetical protein
VPTDGDLPVVTPVGGEAQASPLSPSIMPDYRVFGGVLRSDLSFEEIPETCGDGASWHLRTGLSGHPPQGARLLGSDSVIDDVEVRLFRSRAGLHLVFDDTGAFRVSLDGARIDWTPTLNVDEDAARLDVIGRVLATALHAGGVLTLHGSAVSVHGRTVAFLGPKRFGKSTLALALVDRGCRLVTDDTLPVAVDAGGAFALPGVHHVRVHADAMHALRAGVAAADAVQKTTLRDLAADRVEENRTPLDALYLLVPVKAASDAPDVTRTRLAPLQAALSLMTHAKLGPLLGGSEAASLLARASALANRCPAFTLHVARDLDRIDRVVERILAWHPASASVHA